MQNNEQKRTTGDEKTAPDKTVKDAPGQKKAAAETPDPVSTAEPAVDDTDSRKSEEEKPVAPVSRKAETAKTGSTGDGTATAKTPGPAPEDRERTINRLREFRIERMMSKAELARKAGLSVLTVSRIESGYGCRMDTKRKILKALGLRLSDRRRVFEDD
ncbi:MAG TPA: helix-turn-helix domain-containing protein [Polyangia bacterium]|nr:helix-turn-helix domain-containing protein [Polyangia bacterium]